MHGSVRGALSNERPYRDRPGGAGVSACDPIPDLIEQAYSSSAA